MPSEEVDACNDVWYMPPMARLHDGEAACMPFVTKVDACHWQARLHGGWSQHRAPGLLHVGSETSVRENIEDDLKDTSWEAILRILSN